MKTVKILSCLVIAFWLGAPMYLDIKAGQRQARCIANGGKIVVGHDGNESFCVSSKEAQ